MVSILGLGDLANNIASATKGLATAFGLANPEPAFPQFPEQAITSNFQREHWYKTPSQGLYAFSVEPVGQGTVSEFPAFVDNIKSLFTGFFNPGESFGEFHLPLTPQEITQTENFAVSMTPTQGGTVVRHSGNKYKTLTISGTTGVQPYRGILGVFKGNGLAIGKPDELKYRSGYEVFQHFRQWMRSYHEIKAQPGKESLRMLWRNYKDWEFLYVEPITFTMKRDASKPLQYNYTIQFKVIGVHTIEKPLFDLVVAKLNEVSVALVNTYVLIKKNKSVTEAITGILTDFEDSINNLKMAIKAANKEDLKLAEFSKSDAKKLSFKETLAVMGVIGNAMVASVANQKSSEQGGSAALTGDPVAKGKALAFKAANPSITNVTSAKAELVSLLESEPALLNTIDLSSLPLAVQQSLAAKQVQAALMAKDVISDIQVQAQTLANKLTEGVGLSDDTFDQIFGVTNTIAVENQNVVTDDQFEMLYALSQCVALIDQVLSNDNLFDTNSALYRQNDATNSADSVAQGIFSFPNPNTGIREGYLSAGVTLEDIALSELGDASRWTEIAELNGLKAPYLIEQQDTLSPSYYVESTNYYNPTQIRDLQITFTYQVPPAPTPTGAWTGKGNNLAEFLGGDPTVATNWRFIYPDDGMVIQVISTQDYFKWDTTAWTLTSPDDFSFDGVLKPGDKIKLPSTSTPNLATKLQGPRDNLYTNSLPASERSLGVDLKLTDDLDLDLTPSGDLNVSFGVDNGAQAIVLKLLYEKGSLKKFPSIGTNLTPGKKMPDIANLRSDLLTSLLQDSRIKDVTKINLIQVNSTVNLSFEVIFNDVQQPVPITIPV